jgi:repressor LexA
MAIPVELSERQVNILRMIWDHLQRFDFPPTIREIGEAVGISSTSVVTYNLDILERRGLIARDRDKSRGLRLNIDLSDDEIAAPRAPFRDSRLVQIPLLGVIAAGVPIEVPEDTGEARETITLTADLVGSAERTYALRVRGHSMIEDLINDGDIVILRSDTTINNGDTVAAWIKDRRATTLKRIHQSPGSATVRLIPANPTMQPFEEPIDNVEVQGKVVCVIRRLD